MIGVFIFLSFPILTCAALFSVLEGFAPKLNLPSDQQYEIHRAFNTLAQQWNSAHDASEGEENPFQDICSHVLCNPQLGLPGSITTESFISAWNSHPASTWTTQELSDWLATLPDIAKHRHLFVDHKITGALLPSFLILERTSVIKDQLTPEDLRAIEYRIMALIVYGPPSDVSMPHLILLTSSFILGAIFPLCLVLWFYRASRRVQYERLEIMNQYECRWSDLHLKISALEKEMPSISLRPASSKKRSSLNGLPKNRRSSSVSEASQSAASVMQQLLNMTIATEQAYLLDALERTKDQLESADRQVHDRRFRSLFITRRPELRLEFQRCDRSLCKLNAFLAELKQRWCYMHEAMDILATLNDCHWQVESSYHGDKVTPLEVDSSLPEPIKFREQLDELVPPVAPLAPGSANLDSFNEAMPFTPSPSYKPSTPSEEVEDSIYVDENLPTSHIEFPPVDDIETKIPKPSRIPSHTLTPSFHLMNPPAIKMFTGLATPSHIPIGPLKQPTGSSIKSNLTRSLSGPTSTVPQSYKVESRRSTEWHAIRTPGFMHGSKVQENVNSPEPSS